MFRHVLKITMVSTIVLAGASVSAFADCESDMIQLETAMKSTTLKSDQVKLLKDAGVKASTALRKDDDAACHKAIADAFTATGLGALK